MSVQHLLVMSDTHVGSTLAVMRPGYVDMEGEKHEGNKLQRWLWDMWRRMEDDVAAAINGEEFAILHNGDVIEGMHHRTTQVVTADPADQPLMALEVLDPLFEDADKAFMVEGTECHTKNTEHSIARRLGCTPDPQTNKFAWPHLTIEINGTLISAAHHVGTTSKPYLETSQYAPVLNSERLWAARQGERMPDHIFRAHRHVYGHWEDDCGAMTITPAWQGLTRFGRKVVAGARVTCGVVLLSWDDEGDYCTRKFLYKLRTAEGEILKV